MISNSFRAWVWDAKLSMLRRSVLAPFSTATTTLIKGPFPLDVMWGTSIVVVGKTPVLRSVGIVVAAFRCT
jgi:hypothetical protein